MKDYQRKYRAEHHEMVLEKKRQYRLDNPEKVRAQERVAREMNRQVRRERHKLAYWRNHEIERERGKRSYQKHKAARLHAQREYYVENQESIREYQRNYRRRNPEKKKAQDIRRRATKLGLPDSFSAGDWNLAVAFFDGCCAVCGRQPGLWHTLAADHWIPLRSPDCPGTVTWNIVPLCHGDGGCNNSKHARNPADWLIATYGKRKGMVILRRVEEFLEGRKPNDN